MDERSGTQELLLMPDAGDDPFIGTVIDGRYRILSLIAVGGMGRVYRAEQTSLGRIVAIKLLSLAGTANAADPQFRERFALEAATASKLANPNTVTIFDYGKTDRDLYYLVMEFVDGITLSRLLKAEKRLLPERALQIVRQISHSLVEAHARGIVHRDIKPANILLLHPDLEWVKVLDFGIAKFLPEKRSEDLEEQLTQVGTFVGTPEYMPPEAFYGHVDARADIYSVGVLLYLMLSGRVPFQGPTQTATILMLVNEPVPRFDPALGVSPSLEEVILRCLARKPEERYQTMGELLVAVSTCLVELGAALNSPTHPTITGTGLKPVLAMTLGQGRTPAASVPLELPPPTVPPSVAPAVPPRKPLLLALAAVLGMAVVGLLYLLLGRTSAGPGITRDAAPPTWPAVVAPVLPESGGGTQAGPFPGTEVHPGATGPDASAIPLPASGEGGRLPSDMQEAPSALILPPAAPGPAVAEAAAPPQALAPTPLVAPASVAESPTRAVRKPDLNRDVKKSEAGRAKADGGASRRSPAQAAPDSKAAAEPTLTSPRPTAAPVELPEGYKPSPY